MRLLRSETYRRMRWKNGGGETAEIAVFPVNAGLDDFDWRISMATVEAGGPFSLFPGVERTLAVLDGGGLRLEVAGRKPVELTVASEPFAFAGDKAAAASLIGGPFTDLNVMTRRAKATHRLMRFDAPATIDATAVETLLFCRSGAVNVRCDGSPATLAPKDTLMFGSRRGTVRIEADGPAEMLLIEIDSIR
jgi:uncharacterized protein